MQTFSTFSYKQHNEQHFDVYTRVHSALHNSSCTFAIKMKRRHWNAYLSLSLCTFGAMKMTLCTRETGGPAVCTLQRLCAGEVFWSATSLTLSDFLCMFLFSVVLVVYIPFPDFGTLHFRFTSTCDTYMYSDARLCVFACVYMNVTIANTRAPIQTEAEEARLSLKVNQKQQKQPWDRHRIKLIDTELCFAYTRVYLSQHICCLVHLLSYAMRCTYAQTLLLI